MDAFIDLVKELFPSSVTPFIAEEAKKSLRQFRKENKFGIQSYGLGKTYDFFDHKHEDFLRQGDIVDDLNFLYFDETGEQQLYSGMGILLSNTCDASRDQQLHFAPLIPIDSTIETIKDEIKKKNVMKDVKDNRVFKFIYLPHNKIDEYVADLNLITSFPRIIIEQRMRDKLINKVLSLNTIGFYFLLCKLTVYFMREEKIEETFREKSEYAG